MEIVVGAAVAAVVSATVVVLLGRSRFAAAGAASRPDATPAHGRLTAATATRGAGSGAEAPGRVAEAPVPDGGGPVDREAVRDEITAELRERRAEIARIEERLLRKEEAFDVQLGELERRETSLGDRQRNLDNEVQKL